MNENDARTVWVGNLADQVNEELLYELFLQAGPIERVKIPTDRGRQSNFGFVTFKHEASVPYTLELLKGVQLFERVLNIKPRNGGVQYKHQSPVVQRSISFPNDRNQHGRFDDYNMAPRPHPNAHLSHTSFDDLIGQGHMLNVNFDYTNGPKYFRGEENDRRDFGRHGDDHHNRDRRHGRNQGRHQHKKNDRRNNNYGRNRDKRNHSNY
ncbi:RNA-binding protein 7 [Anthonomus grandis grandis]|uniref:RNA-binding protein 7 n=1 Tax=Anthonomus grandis grandis TaxID=2921223 RepID=UPI0021668B6C|nr:RNA-binding protein 7 [Anthonomus grandis grandis]